MTMFGRIAIFLFFVAATAPAISQASKVRSVESAHEYLAESLPDKASFELVNISRRPFAIIDVTHPSTCVSRFAVTDSSGQGAIWINWSDISNSGSTGIFGKSVMLEGRILAGVGADRPTKSIKTLFGSISVESAQVAGRAAAAIKFLRQACTEKNEWDDVP